ncbi:MAG: GntR family transcriptional regulator [Gemmatimonadaceae bacterium]
MAEVRDRITQILRQRVLRGLHASSLRRGDRLPSARDLEPEFDTDHRVILAAYRALAKEGLVELRQRGGIYVAAEGSTIGGLPAISSEWVADLFVQGISREIPVPELHEWLRRLVETLRIRAVAIATTADQVTGLARELRDEYGLEASGLSAASLGSAEDLPTDVRRADLLVTTEAHAAPVQAIAERLRKPCVVIAIRPDVIGGEWRFLLRRPVYVVVADAHFVKLLDEFFAGTPGAENVRALVIGRDDLDAIPDGAPTYVTREARERLGTTRIRGRILPAARLLSDESSREIIQFIVRANLEALAARTR